MTIRAEMNVGTDEDAIRELYLYIENDPDLYKQKHIPIIKNYIKKKERGTYNKDLAIKGFMYLVDEGARKYIKDFGSPNDTVQDIFPKRVREEVAKEFEEKFEDTYTNDGWSFQDKESTKIKSKEELDYFERLKNTYGTILNKNKLLYLFQEPYPSESDSNQYLGQGVDEKGRIYSITWYIPDEKTLETFNWNDPILLTNTFETYKG